MEERNNKSNTMILTVIAIATLLVAVIGATFAYFTATIENNETESRVIVNGALLTIAFSDDDNQVKSETDIIPTKSTDGGTTYASVISKTFTLSGTNTTGNTENQGTNNATIDPMRMPYELYLIVTKNTFGLKHNFGTEQAPDWQTAITYKLVNNDNTLDGIIPNSGNVYGNIGAKTLETRDKLPDSDEKQVAADQVQAITVYQDNGTVLINNETGFKLGQGYFPARNDKTAVNHTYTLNVYYKETGKNQSLDKQKEFEGYIAISVGDRTTALSKTFNAVNCAVNPTAKIATDSNTAACTPNYKYVNAN